MTLTQFEAPSGRVRAESCDLSEEKANRRKETERSEANLHLRL